MKTKLNWLGIFVLLSLWGSAHILLAQKGTNRGEVSIDYSVDIGVEQRLFFVNGLYPGQSNHYFSIYTQPEFTIEWDHGDQRIVADLFGRLSTHDQRRSHWDIRELYYQNIGKNWEVSVGLKKIFWGVTESTHVVDVINQTDLIESFDFEQKLGQPMAQFTYLANFGTLELFLLPYFRKRTFPGPSGRLRPPLPITHQGTLYESDAEEWHTDAALRYSHSFSVFDFGWHYFRGTSREPIIQATENALVPFYPQMRQTGLDLQATTGPWLWKFEGIFRTLENSDVVAFDAGFEYTFSNINNTGLDIGILGEYAFDSRGEKTPSGFDNDIFLGSRIAFNDIQDTELLIGGVIDLEQSSKLFSIEANRRFFNSWTAELELRLLSGLKRNELFYPARNDSFLEFTIIKHL